MKPRRENRAKKEDLQVPTTTEEGKIVEPANEENKSEDNKTINIEREYRKIRNWKTITKERFSSIKKDASSNTSWKHKMRVKSTRDNVKKICKQLEITKNIENEERKKKQATRRAAKLERQRKSEITVNVTNPRKIKKIRKKHLRKDAM